MNTWRDIKAAKPMEVILATEDSNVYVGVIRDYDNRDLVFRGFNLQDGITHLCMTEDLDGWQPVPDTWKPEKSADEMFRAEKYTIKEEHDGHTVYKTGQRCHIQKKICIDKNLNFTKHWKLSATCENQTFSKGEILACAQLIQGMEAPNADNR